MKKQLFKCIIPLFIIICAFAGCNSEPIETSMNDDIQVSGDLEYYSELDKSTLEEKCKEKHIEITGVVSNATYTMFNIGETSDDSLIFICTFNEYSDTLKEINNGDTITVHGKCTNIIGDYIYLMDCQLSETSVNTTEMLADTTTPSTKPKLESDTTISESIAPSTEASTAPSTEPPHSHKFSKATCTSPKSCSCGATEGKANGHKWSNATCTSPKTCTECGKTSGLTAGHNFYNGNCTTCGKADPDYVSETMVWIPTNGGTKYHTNENCSNMYNPEYVTQSTAESLGFTPCKRCH